MIKHIYKGVFLVVVFVAALIFFGHQLETDINDTGTEMTMEKESFPILQILTQGRTINPLYGYAAPMEPDIVRESMTPLAADRTMTVLLAGDSTSRLTRLSYQIVDKESGEVYDKQDVSAVSKDQRQIEITFGFNFKTSTEYILDLIGTTDAGREIHYYTRVKYYQDDSNLGKKLDFVKKFHKNTFIKSKADELEKYLEPSSKNRNSTLASVDITSSSDLVTWGGLSPKLISDEYVTVKEYNMETACVQYNYFVRAKTSSAMEQYHVKETYRVRYASGHSYLLNFKRTMEAQFDTATASRAANQLKLGITNDTSGSLLTTVDEKMLYFARGGTLYCYEMDQKQIIPVYESFSPDASYRYKAYDEQGIRLLKIAEDGTVYFCAYGYFSRGSYEGDVAVVLYAYNPESGLEEMVYMPIRSTYQQLTEDFASYGYVSPRGVYYFTVADTVYAYNMSGKRLEKIAEHINSDTFKTMESANCYAWSSSMSAGYGKSITLFNMEKDERKMIYSPDEDTYIRLLGVIDNNVVYGYVKKSDVGHTRDGARVAACYKLCIADTGGNVLKEYRKGGRYIRKIESNGNVINLTLCKKNGAYYEDAEADSILNQGEKKTSRFDYVSRVTTKCLTEWYISFPSSFEMGEIPTLAKEVSTYTTNERTVRLEQPKVVRYYVYAMGEITGCYESAAKAVRAADKEMGVVMSSEHQVIWERSGSFLQNNIGGIELVKSGGSVSSQAACAYMVLKQNHVDVELSSLDITKPVYTLLSEHMDGTVSLNGCTLEEVLYFVSSNKPVVGILSDSQAVVIEGYTTAKLYLLDPASGKRKTVSRSEYEKKFKNAGNRFVSYTA